MEDKIFFLSKDANWQHYRNEVFLYLAQKRRVNVEILTTGVLKPYLQQNERLKYKVFKNVFNPNFKYSFFPASIFYILKNRPKCVIALNNATQITEYLALVICRLFGIKFIWWTHGYDHQPIKNRLKRTIKNYYVQFFLKLADNIITFSHRGKKYLLGRGIKNEKIFVAPNTLNTVKLINIRKELSSSFVRTEFLKSVGITIDEYSKVLLFSGRINRLKKLDNAFYALKKVLNKKKNVHLIVIGEGEHVSFLKELSNTLEIANWVHFVGSQYNDEIVAKYFLSADIFLMPAYVGLAIVHAFSFSLPILTEDIDNHGPETELLKNGENGFFIEENNVEEMATKVIEVLSNDELMKYLRRNAFETVEQEANIDNMVEQMYKAIY